MPEPPVVSIIVDVLTRLEAHKVRIRFCVGSAYVVSGASITKKTLAAGTHSITAEYMGDGTSGKSTSAALNEVVQ